MPIAFDSASSLAASSGVSTISWNHTVGTSVNSILIVSAGFRTTASSLVDTTAVTYGGVSLTKAISFANQTGARTQVRENLWYLLNPASGVSSIHVTYSNSSISFPHGAFGVSYTGTSGVGNTSASTATSSGPLLAFNITSSQNLAIGGFRSNIDVLLSTSGSETLRVASTAGTDYGGIADESVSLPGDVTIRLNGGTAVANVVVGLELLTTVTAVVSSLFLLNLMGVGR